MNERFRRAIASPGAQLVVGAIVLALAFPARASGAIGLAVIAGALGVAVAAGWPALPDWVRAPTDRMATALVLTIVAAVGLSVFWDVMTVSPDWQMGDWGPQRAVLARALPSMPGWHAPVWNHVVGTGDAPLELYPSLTYYVVGHAALALGLEHDLPLAFMVVAVVVHVAIAIATTAIAMRVAPRPIALLVGIATLVDSGAVAHGGTVGLFRWALLHSAFALACGTLAAVGALAALSRPRLAASAAIWIGTALACIAHPAGIIAAAASLVALALVAALAADVPPRRALAAMGHVAIGVALGAFAWMPLAERILEYGQHFPNALRSPARLLEDLLLSPTPVTAFAALSYAGYLGILAGLFSRRATVIFVAATAFVLLLGLCEAPYLALDLAPGQGVARLGTERLAQLARPFVGAASAYGLAILFGHARAAWRGATQQRRYIAAALLGIIVASTVRALPAVWTSASDRAVGEAQTFAPDPGGRALLEAWATEQVRAMRPDAWARALFQEDTHEHFHLTAETGLPTFHLAPQPDLLLRERIEDASPESLRRFNVRWVVAIDHAPTLGDEGSEVVLGSYHIRTLRNWDGQFARIEKGTGTVHVTRLDDNAVELDVTGTTEPVLVALGTGYYPRWRAHHASGAEEPVFALPSTPGSRLHVVSAWLAPGHTIFTCDGQLPSDGKGRLLSVLAALLAIGAVVVWSRRRWRTRVLRRIARLRPYQPVWLGGLARYGVPALLTVLVVKGCIDDKHFARDLELGDGMRATADVSARHGGGEWQSCSYYRATGTYACAGLASVGDGMGSLLNDAAPSWAFNTPAIEAMPEANDVELRIVLHERLAGTYWTATSGPSVTLEVEHMARRAYQRDRIEYEDHGERAIEIRAALPPGVPWSFTFVHQSTLMPDRSFLAPPPDDAPVAVRTIH